MYVRSGARGVAGHRPTSERTGRGDDPRAESWFFSPTLAPSRGHGRAMPSRENEGAGQLVAGPCYLDLIFVVPRHWGEGIGALLLDTVITDGPGAASSASTC